MSCSLKLQILLVLLIKCFILSWLHAFSLYMRYIFNGPVKYIALLEHFELFVACLCLWEVYYPVAFRCRTSWIIWLYTLIISSSLWWRLPLNGFKLRSVSVSFLSFYNPTLSTLSRSYELDMLFTIPSSLSVIQFH